MRLREALGCSLNVPAVFVLSQLGARPTFYQLQKWGFNFPQGLDDYGAGFVLGNAETRLVDLAAAYAGLARGGTAMRAKFLVSEHQPLTRIASAEATAIIADILRDNDARQKSFGLRSPLAFEERVAAKTGTSSGFRDTWTVGFDKEHTVAVWAGNFDGRPMRDTFAVRAATPLWATVEMTTFHVGLAEHLAAFARVRAKWVQEPYPAWTAVGVAELAAPAALVEVKVVAVL